MTEKYSPEVRRLAREVRDRIRRDLAAGRFDVPLSPDGMPARRRRGQVAAHRILHEPDRRPTA